MARQLGKGQFLAYVGQYAYLVDCFATSTDWEYELFKTDDAVQTADHLDTDIPMMDAAQLDAIWPAVTPDDPDLLDIAHEETAR
jgi:hypothetical protein